MKRFISSLLSLVLVAALFLTGCTQGPISTLSGDYSQDVITVMDSITTSIELPTDDPNKSAAQTTARDQINDFIARYRRDQKTAGLSSFMTMGTALNSLAGHYNSYPNRPVPEKLKARLAQQFKAVKIALKRESAA